MAYLLDTHTLLRGLADDPRLSAVARAVLDRRAEVHVSAASFAEIAIENSVGKLDMEVDEVEKHVAAAHFTELPIRVRHAKVLRHLPFLHRDPFDRLIVAQAIVEGLTLVSADRQIRRYGVPTIG